jgi:hypothetical protein
MLRRLLDDNSALGPSSGRQRFVRFLVAAILVGTAVMIPSSATALVDPEPGGGCTHPWVSPAHPAGADWNHGQDIDLVNCMGKVHFANVWCHPWPSLEADTVCWAYRIPAYTIQHVSVGTYKQVHKVDWY